MTSCHHVVAELRRFYVEHPELCCGRCFIAGTELNFTVTHTDTTGDHNVTSAARNAEAPDPPRPRSSRSPGAASEVSEMRKNEAFPSRWLKADDFLDGAKVFTISGVGREEIEGDEGSTEKTVMSFVGVDQKWIFGSACWDMLEEMFADGDSDRWIGQRVELYRAKVSFKGKQTFGVRPRLPQAKNPAAPSRTAAKATRQPEPEDYPFAEDGRE